MEFFNFLLVLLSSFTTWLVIRSKRGTLQEEARKTLHQLELDISTERRRFSDEMIRREKELNSKFEIQKSSLDQEKQKLKALIEKAEKKNEEVSLSLKKIARKEKEISAETERVHILAIDAEKRLLERANLSSEEAKELVLINWRERLQPEYDILVEEALSSALERITPIITKDHFTDRIIAADYEKVVPKLIGKDGRNIQTFEQTIGGGISISFDQQERSITITSHNSALRQLAVYVIQQLIDYDKITPKAVIDTIEKARISSKLLYIESTKHILKKAFPEALELDSKIIEALADLSIRTSFGQNLLLHSIEVAHLMHSIANELQLHPLHDIALIGLLHDIGKALPSSWGETHSKAGAYFLANHGIKERIVKSILSHHGEAPKESTEAHLLVIADRISGGLLGSRYSPLTKNSHHSYVLEKIDLYLKEKFPFNTIWVSYRHTENHRGGTIEVVVRSRKVFSKQDVQKNPENSVYDEKNHYREIEKSLKKEFPHEEFHITLLPKIH